MPNFIESIGYASGKLHTGLIAYLCDLFQAGDQDPLTTLFGALDVPLPRRAVGKREWNSVDLAIFDGTTKDPHVLVEMKVDDHEHNARRTGTPQTIYYADQFPAAADYLYITLGMGEFCAAPKGSRFRWIDIRRFLSALDQINTDDRIIQEWRNAIRHEVDRQNRTREGDSTRLQDYRTGAWNIYLLGFLKNSIEEKVKGTEQDFPLDCTCYAYGPAPDTILNFGGNNTPAYMEITNNGRLNFKLNLEHLQTTDAKKQFLAEAIADIEDRYSRESYRIHSGGRVGKSKTVASFDIGFASRAGHLEHVVSRDSTRDETIRILEIFHRERPAFLGTTRREEN